MNPTGPRKILVRWRTRETSVMDAVRSHLGLPDYNTLNGLTPGMLADEDREAIDGFVRLGYISWWDCEWTYAHGRYSW